MTIVRIPEELKDVLERQMKAKRNRTGPFVLSVATSSVRKIAYELLPVDSRESAISALADSYHRASGPQHRALVVNSPDEARTVGSYFVEIDSGRLQSDELLVFEEFKGIHDRGEYRICSPDLRTAIDSHATASRNGRPAF